MSTIICDCTWCQQCRLTVIFCSLHLSSPRILFYHNKRRLGCPITPCNSLAPHDILAWTGQSFVGALESFSFFTPHWAWFLSIRDELQVIVRYFVLNPSTPVYSHAPSLLQLVMPFLAKHRYFCLVSLTKAWLFKGNFFKKGEALFRWYIFQAIRN